MEPTKEMIEAESRRRDSLSSSQTLIESAKGFESDWIREQYLVEAIKLQMIGSHAGRIG